MDTWPADARVFSRPSYLQGKSPGNEVGMAALEYGSPEVWQPWSMVALKYDFEWMRMRMFRSDEGLTLETSAL